MMCKNLFSRSVVERKGALCQAVKCGLVFGLALGLFEPYHAVAQSNLRIPTEACCFPDGACEDALVGQCPKGTTPQGEPSACGIVTKCCFPDGTCTEMDQVCCDDLGGNLIPTVSNWGLAVMGLLVLTAGTIVLARRRRMLAGK